MRGRVLTRQNAFKRTQNYNFGEQQLQEQTHAGDYVDASNQIQEVHDSNSQIVKQVLKRINTQKNFNQSDVLIFWNSLSQCHPDFITNTLDHGLQHTFGGPALLELGLHLSTMAGNTAIPQHLIQAGDNLNATHHSTTPLQMCSVLNQVQPAQLLIEAGADVNHRSTLPAQAANRCHTAGMTDYADALLSQASHDPSTLQAGSALQLAALNGHLEVVQLLLAAGADPNAPAQLALTAHVMQILVFLQRVEHIETIKYELLTDSDQATNSSVQPSWPRGHSIAQRPGVNGQRVVQTQRPLVFGQRPNNIRIQYREPYTVGDTPTHLSLQFNHLTTACALLAADYDVNMCNVRGESVLHYAAQL